jgi:hypothetical protein
MSRVDWARVLMASLANALWTWVFTVCRERCSCVATERWSDRQVLVRRRLQLAEKPTYFLRRVLAGL